MSSTDEYRSDHWYSTGQDAYDGDDRIIPPRCPVCASTHVEFAWVANTPTRCCTDGPRHRAALSTPEGQHAARVLMLAY